MAAEGIFRFITVRPAKVQVITSGLTTLVETSALFRQLAEAAAQDADHERLREIARGYSSPNRSAESVPTVLDLAPLHTWFYEHQEDRLDAADMAGLIRRSYGMSLSELAGGAKFAATRDCLTDRLLKAAMLGDESGHAAEDLLDAKLLGLAASLASPPGAGPKSPDQYSRDGSGPASDRSLGELVADTPAMLPSFFANMRAAVSPRPPVSADGTAAQEEARAWLDQLECARRELLRQILDGRHIVFRRATGDAAESHGADGRDADRTRQAAPDPSSNQPGQPGQPYLSPDGVARLTEKARGALDRLDLLAGGVRPFQAIPVIEAEMLYVSGQTADSAQNMGILAFDGGEVDLRHFHQAMSNAAPALEPPPTPQHSAAGVADLLVVRQKIKAYELGEFAHIENVMAGETRKRDTRRLTQVEEITETETEVTTEKEKDLQSTERDELQNEAEKHVKSQLDIEAGLQVSGSYGPAVSFTSSLKAGHSTTTEEAQRKASSFSQEVTQRTVEKVRERIRTLIRRRTLEEFEEKNLHEFTNNSSRHTRGVYRWLNKIYDAQVFNYGQRLMFDFVVPEPAAYFLYGLVANPAQSSDLVKPAAPTHNGVPLRPSHLGTTNYGEFIARYRVPNAPILPPTTRTVSFFEKQDAGTSATVGRAGKIDIPEGYAASTATLQMCMLPVTGIGVISISGELHAFNGSDTEQATLGLEEKEISVAISAKAEAWAAAIDVHCISTADATARWQQAAFDAIMAAYQRQLTEYNDRKAQRELQLSTNQFGRNPLINRRVERDELKKWVIMMLTKNPNLNVNSFQPPSDPPEPVIDLDQANNNGKFIRFLENSFEWQNMLYVCYPHMWGRRARWISALNITDPDPDFAAFLRAGAARVQVPVRPGFERAVAHFVHMGTIWEGNDVPMVNDDLYVPIITEITSNLGKIEGGVPYPANSKPWEVTVPTDLVLSQEVSEIPPFRDALRAGAMFTLDGESLGDGLALRPEPRKAEPLETAEAAPTRVPASAQVSDSAG
jgi:hypothetical protein